MFDAVTLSKYGGVLAALVLAGIGLPIPEEIPIVTAGAMVGHDAQALAHHEDLVGAVGGGPASYLSTDPPSITRWWIMLPLCIVGVVVADTGMYTLGRIGGTRILQWKWVRKRVLPPEKQLKIEANFAKYGILILLGARFTPGVRSPVFIMAGVLRMPLSRFLLADGLYAIPGVCLLFWLAYIFTDQFVEAINAVERHRPMVIMAVVAAIGGVVLYKFLSSRRLSTGDPEEIPIYVKPVGVVTHAVEQTIEKAVGKTVEVSAKAAAAVVDKVTHPLGHHHLKPPPPAAPGVNGPPSVPDASSERQSAS
jgi:membrane protein DedA with SNARE-associated domain